MGNKSHRRGAGDVLELVFVHKLNAKWFMTASHFLCSQVPHQNSAKCHIKTRLSATLVQKKLLIIKKYYYFCIVKK